MAWKKSDEPEVRTNKVLGLGGVTPDRQHQPGEEREGVGTAGEVEPIASTGSAQPTKGATGIDMGAGGNGTDIEP